MNGFSEIEVTDSVFVKKCIGQQHVEVRQDSASQLLTTRPLANRGIDRDDGLTE